MWSLETSFFEILIRSVAVYAVLLLLFRVLGKKQLGEMSPFDFVLLLIISEAVSNGLTGNEHSLTGGLIAAAILLFLGFLLDYLAFKCRKIEKALDGEAQIIIMDGEVIEKVRRKEMITLDELIEVLRENGLEKFEQVKLGVLGTNGKIAIIPKEKA